MTDTKIIVWPPGQLKELGGGGGVSDRQPDALPFLSGVNVPCALTVPLLLTLLAAFGQLPPFVWQAHTALAGDEAVTVVGV